MWWHAFDQEFQRETKEMGTDKNGFILILPHKGMKCLEQVGWDFEQPGVVEGVPAHGSRAGTGWSFWIIPNCSMIMKCLF